MLSQIKHLKFYLRLREHKNNTITNIQEKKIHLSNTRAGLLPKAFSATDPYRFERYLAIRSMPLWIKVDYSAIWKWVFWSSSKMSMMYFVVSIILPDSPADCRVSIAEWLFDHKMMTALNIISNKSNINWVNYTRPIISN